MEDQVDFFSLGLNKIWGVELFFNSEYIQFKKLFFEKSNNEMREKYTIYCHKTVFSGVQIYISIR